MYSGFAIIANVRYDVFAGALRRELPKWVADGLVSGEQADAIAARYPDSADDARRGSIVQALAVIGAIVAGLGVVLFFAANWDAIPRPLRVALLVAALLGAYGGGWTLRHGRATRPNVGGALLLLGGILFGASIFLVGQMYHVQAHDPFAFLLWTAGVAPTAVVLRSRPLATLAILTFGAWIGFELFVRDDGAAAGYIVVAMAFYGAALYAGGTAALERVDRAFTLPARQLGWAIAAVGVFVFTFRPVIGEFARVDRPGGLVLTVGVALAVAAVAAAAGLALRSARGTARSEAAAVIAAVALVGALVLVPETRADEWGDSRAIVYPLLFNLLVLAVALGAVVVGYLEEELWLVNGGLVLMGVEVFARYVDLFWDFLPRSLAFIGAGLVLLALAFALERSRARLRPRRVEA